MIKASVIGAGWYAADSHIPTLAAQRGVVLDGVCRLGADELARVRDAFGFAFASEDHRAVLDRHPDIVVVSSPHGLHYRHALDALEAGAHVLCEKPMTIDPREAWHLVERARALGRHLLIANGYNYLPYLQGVRRDLAAGRIGRIEHVQCMFVSGTRRVFDGEVGLERWKRTFFRPDAATWQDPAQGGGFAYGQMSHSIALMLWLTGLEPVSVAAMTTGNGRVDLTDAAILSCADGAIASLSGSGALPQGNRALMRLAISGSEGLLTLDFDRDDGVFRSFDGRVQRLPLAPGDWVYHCRGPISALVDLAAGHGTNLSPGETGAATVAVLAAMAGSAVARGAPCPVHGPAA
jgi:predicted dehydrogenase